MAVSATAEFDPRAAAAPPGWPRADRPLNIALLGWARLSFQGTQGSGYNLSASELAAGLAMSGHSVFYLASGRRYNLIPGMYISATELWRGVRCFDLVNSLNLSPASYNFLNTRQETACPPQTSIVLRWLVQHKIDVVHVHSLEGFSLDLIGAIRESGRPVVVTPHNYWYACPQVDLMVGERHLCMDYEGGKACTTCLKGRNPRGHRLKRRIGQSLERIVGLDVSGALRRVGETGLERFQQWRKGIPDQPPNGRLPDPETAAGLTPPAGNASRSC